MKILFAIVLTTFAGPTTNREEFREDASLTKAQQQEYTEKFNKGSEYFDAGKYDLAEAEFKSILTFAPKKALVKGGYFKAKRTKACFCSSESDFKIAIKRL